MKIAMLIALACVGQSPDSPVASPEETLPSTVERFASVEDGEPRRELYRTLFEQAAARNSLPSLCLVEDDSIAIQAAWESISPNADFVDEYPFPRPTERQIAWFEGFFEGRARVVPPEWWRNGLINQGSLFGAALRQGSNKTAPPYHSSANGTFNCPIDAQIEKLDSGFVYQVGADKVSIPKELLDDPARSRCDSISGTFTKSHCFMALHDSFGLKHRLVCLERSTNKVLWKAVACGAWYWGGTGQHKSWVKVMPTDDGRVFVFGYAATGLYAHGFHARDGSSLLQFSTNY